MEGVIEYVTKAAGTDAKVVEQKVLLEIRDIDEWLTKKGTSIRIITKRESEKRLSEYNQPQKQVWYTDGVSIITKPLCQFPSREKTLNNRARDEVHFAANCEVPVTVSAVFKQKLRDEKPNKENPHRVSQNEALTGPG
ncbi:hypothetical protein QTP88_006787 [Uroleucon formosanum]